MKKITLLALFLLSLNLSAQRSATQTIPFETAIENLRINAKNGVVFVKEDTKISAYSNEIKKTIWSVGADEIGAKTALAKLADFDLAAIGKDKDPFEIIENSDYIFANINGRDLVINGLSGEVIFNSEKDLGAEVIVNQMFLPAENCFVFLVKTKQNFQFKYFDLATKKIKWMAEAGKDQSGFSDLKNQAYRQDRVESFNENLYALVNNKLFNIDKETGKIKWMIPTINRFFICQNNKNIVITKNIGGMLSTKQAINIINTEDGRFIWKDDIETKAIITLEDWNDKILIAHATGFNMFDLKTGAKTWKKDVKGKGFKQVLPLETDFLFVADNNMMLIDKDAKEIWKSEIEISDNAEDQIYYLGKTKRDKVMYITQTYANMVDYKTGKKLWKRNIKFNPDRPLLNTYDEEKDIFLIYNDEELYKFDPNLDDKPEPFAKIKAKSDKTMAGIELFDWGVSLTSQSEVIGVGMNGALIYQNQYKQPGEAGRVALKALGTVGSSYLGAKASTQNSAANLQYELTYRDEKGVKHTHRDYLFNDASRNDLLNKSANNAAASEAVSLLTQNVSTRFNALKQNSEFAYLFAKDESSAEGSSLKVLVKIRKSDGKEIDKIIVDNNKPLYDIDAATETIYYGKGNQLLIFE